MEAIKGLTVIFTGDGKGKTSSAMGVCLRAMGRGINCRVVQFIKGNTNTGELKMAEQLDLLTITQAGRGFTWTKGTTAEEHRIAAQDGLKEAMEELTSGRYGVMVLDEILYALGKQLVTIEQIFSLIDAKPPSTHLVLTGRGAPQELIDRADMVSEIRAVKHPFQAGIPAQPGLDF